MSLISSNGYSSPAGRSNQKKPRVATFRAARRRPAIVVPVSQTLGSAVVSRRVIVNSRSFFFPLTGSNLRCLACLFHHLSAFDLATCDEEYTRILTDHRG